MSVPDLFRMELNGVPVHAEELRMLLFANYGHFTGMTIQNGRVRGLRMHLERLQQGTQTLFGEAIDPSHIQALVRQALQGTSARVEVRVDVFSHLSGLDPSQHIGVPDVLVTVRTVPPFSLSPLRVRSTHYERDLPQIKHVGTFGLNYQYRLAQLHGFDDALFTNAAGRISEGSAWNVGVFDGQRITWPVAPALPGIAMRLVQAGLAKRQIPFERRDISLRDLPAFRAAFLTNCRVGVQAIASVDEVQFVVDDDLHALLKACYEANPAEEV